MPAGTAEVNPLIQCMPYKHDNLNLIPAPTKSGHDVSPHLHPHAEEKSRGSLGPAAG